MNIGVKVLIGSKIPTTRFIRYGAIILYHNFDCLPILVNTVSMIISPEWAIIEQGKMMTRGPSGGGEN